MRAKEEAYRILEAALSVASNGVDEAEICLGGGDLGVTRFANNQIYPAMEQSREVLSVRVVSGERMCRVETTDLSTNGIKEASLQARSRVEHMPESAKCAGLPKPQTYQGVDAYDPETEALKGLDRTAMAARAVLAGHKNNLQASGLVAVRRGALGLDNVPSIFAVANTRGLLAYHPETRIRFSTTMRAEGADPNVSSSGWAEDESFTSVALEIDALVATAVEKASHQGTPKTLKPGSFTAVLEPAAMGALIKQLGPAAGAAQMASGASFLSGKLGEKIVHESITIHDDFAHPLHRGLPFDVEGVARQRVTLVQEGVATSPVYCWQSASRLEAEPTGHLAYDPFWGEIELAEHLVMEGGAATSSDLIGSTKSGVLISRLGGIQMLDSRNLTLTGVTRDGIFAIENGEITAPLRNMRFSVNLLELLSSVEAMSASVWAEGTVVPTAKVEGFNLYAGV